MLRHLLPSAGSRGASSPASAVLRGAPTPERPSRRASLPSLGGTSRASQVRSRRRAARRRRAWGLVFGPPTDLSRGDDQVSQVPGEPSAYMPCSSTPARSRCPASSTPRCSLPPCQQRRPSQPWVLRGSIPRPARSLCTLRSRDHSRTTQHSVPAGGQPLPGGTGYPQGSHEGFRHHEPSMASSSSRFSWRTDNSPGDLSLERP
jgi:hypothetical protein